MRGAAGPRTPRLKRKDTLHAYRVAANATDLLKSDTAFDAGGGRDLGISIVLGDGECISDGFWYRV